MNMESIGSTDDEKVACIISCCDKKPYSLKDNGYDKNCQRLGSRKHSCVFRNARQVEEEDKKSKIKASPRYTAEKYPELKPLLAQEGKSWFTPDIVIGSRVIDAKFPCPEKVANTTGNQTLSQPSPSVVRTMSTPKEEDIYPKLPGIDSSEPMKPEQAEESKGKCDCRSVQ